MALFWDVEVEKYLFAYVSSFCFKFKIKLYLTLYYMQLIYTDLQLIQPTEKDNQPMNYAFVCTSILFTSSFC